MELVLTVNDVESGRFGLTTEKVDGVEYLKVTKDGKDYYARLAETPSEASKQIKVEKDGKTQYVQAYPEDEKIIFLNINDSANNGKTINPFKTYVLSGKSSTTYNGVDSPKCSIIKEGLIVNGETADIKIPSGHYGYTVDDPNTKQTHGVTKDIYQLDFKPTEEVLKDKLTIKIGRAWFDKDTKIGREEITGDNVLYSDEFPHTFSSALSVKTPIDDKQTRQKTGLVPSDRMTLNVIKPSGSVRQFTLFPSKKQNEGTVWTWRMEGTKSGEVVNPQIQNIIDQAPLAAKSQQFQRIRDEWAKIYPTGTDEQLIYAYAAKTFAYYDVKDISKAKEELISVSKVTQYKDITFIIQTQNPSSTLTWYKMTKDTLGEDITDEFKFYFSL